MTAMALTGCAKHVKAVDATLAPAEQAPAASPADTGYGLRAATVDYLPPSSQSPMGLPANAAPDDCYVQTVVPAQYGTATERVLKTPASSRIEIAPAETKEVEERAAEPRSEGRDILCLVEVPAEYKEVTRVVIARRGAVTGAAAAGTAPGAPTHAVSEGLAAAQPLTPVDRPAPPISATPAAG